MHDRLRIGPDPGQRPQQAAEHERQQAQRTDGLELRVVPLVRDLLRQDVHHPEEGDEHDRHDEEDEDGDESRQRVFGLLWLCDARLGRCQEDQGKREEDDTPVVKSRPRRSISMG